MPQKDKNSTNRERKKNHKQKGKDTFSVYSQKHIRNTVAILDRKHDNTNTTTQQGSTGSLPDDAGRLKGKKK